MVEGEPESNHSIGQGEPVDHVVMKDDASIEEVVEEVKNDQRDEAMIQEEEKEEGRELMKVVANVEPGVNNAEESHPSSIKEDQSSN